MVKFLRYRTVFKLYEKIQPYLQYSLHVEHDFPFKSAMVLAPHMDDEAIGCGGTLLKLAKMKVALNIVFLTTDKEERKKEALRSCSLVGVDAPVFLDFDGESLKRKNAELSKQIEILLSEKKPQALFVPFFLDNHVDHRAVNTALKKLKGKYRGIVYAFPVWSPLYPNILVDISKEWEDKKKMISFYKTQLATRDYVKMSFSLGQYWAMVKGRNMEVAETFLRASFEEYVNLIKGVGDL